MISTKGRYALRVMADLALHTADGYVSLSDIAKRQDISLKYLESIIALLNKAGFVDSLRGKSGGYRLNRRSERYTLKEILEATEGDLLPVNCACLKETGCARAEKCLTVPVWRKLDGMISEYLESVTLNDLIGP